MNGETWRTDAHAIDGQEGTHYNLAYWIEGKGFEVVPDPDDMQKSFIGRPGAEDFGERIIGEIVGDEEAKVKITASFDNLSESDLASLADDWEEARYEEDGESAYGRED